VQSLLMGLQPDLVFRTKGQLAIDIAAEVLADGIAVGLFYRHPLPASSDAAVAAKRLPFSPKIIKNLDLRIVRRNEVNLALRQPKPVDRRKYH
jgi:hypothetical protein